MRLLQHHGDANALQESSFWYQSMEKDQIGGHFCTVSHYGSVVNDVRITVRALAAVLPENSASMPSRAHWALANAALVRCSEVK